MGVAFIFKDPDLLGLSDGMSHSLCCDTKLWKKIIQQIKSIMLSSLHNFLLFEIWFKVHFKLQLRDAIIKLQIKKIVWKMMCM